MSEIFNPATSAIKPKVIDGVSNLVTRQAGLSTNAAVQTTIGTTELPPNIFSNDRNNAIVEARFFGRIIGADATTFRATFDGVVIGASGSAAIPSPGTFKAQVIVAYSNAQVNVYFAITRGPTGTNATLETIASFAAPAAYDNNLTHTIALQALTAAGTTTIFCDIVTSQYV
jgi:hypothetical protein